VSYITQAELESLFPDSFLDVSAELWAHVLPAVDGMIDDYLGELYAVPVSPVPAAVKEIAVALARYHLQGSLVYDNEKDNPLKNRYDYALKQLEKYRRDELKLSGALRATDCLAEVVTAGDAW
jgi:phage gp36-like protein